MMSAEARVPSDSEIESMYEAYQLAMEVIRDERTNPEEKEFPPAWFMEEVVCAIHSLEYSLEDGQNLVQTLKAGYHFFGMCGDLSSKMDAEEDDVMEQPDDSCAQGTNCKEDEETLTNPLCEFDLSGCMKGDEEVGDEKPPEDVNSVFNNRQEVFERQSNKEILPCAAIITSEQEKEEAQLELTSKQCKKGGVEFQPPPQLLTGESGLSFYHPSYYGLEVDRETTERWWKYVAWESRRVDFERYLAGIHGMKVTRVDVGAMPDDALTKVEWDLDKSFFDVLAFIHRNTRGGIRDVMSKLEEVAPIVEDLKTSRKGFEEIKNEWSLKGNLKLVNLEKKRKKRVRKRKTLLKGNEDQAKGMDKASSSYARAWRKKKPDGKKEEGVPRGARQDFGKIVSTLEKLSLCKGDSASKLKGPEINSKGSQEPP